MHMCLHVPLRRCGRVCRVGGWEGVGGCGRVWESVGGCGRVWESVGGCGRGCAHTLQSPSLLGRHYLHNRCVSLLSHTQDPPPTHRVLPHLNPIQPKQMSPMATTPALYHPKRLHWFCEVVRIQQRLVQQVALHSYQCPTLTPS